MLKIPRLEKICLWASVISGPPSSLNGFPSSCCFYTVDLKISFFFFFYEWTYFGFSRYIIYYGTYPDLRKQKLKINCTSHNNSRIMHVIILEKNIYRVYIYILKTQYKKKRIPD